MRFSIQQVFIWIKILSVLELNQHQQSNSKTSMPTVFTDQKLSEYNKILFIFVWNRNFSQTMINEIFDLILEKLKSISIGRLRKMFLQDKNIIDIISLKRSF